MKTYKIKTKAVKKPKKDPVLLVKPTEPKAPPKPKPIDIWSALSSDKREELDKKLEDFALELGVKLGGKTTNRWGDEELFFIDCDGNEDAFPEFTSDTFRVVADEMDEFIKRLPGIPETKKLELVTYDWAFSYQAQSLPDLEKIAATNRRYNEAMERYEKNLAIYNSPASKKARAAKEAMLKARQLAAKNAKKEKLLKELAKLDA